MNKAQLIEALSKHYDGSKAEAAKALSAVVQTITHQTAAGQKVSITGFGVFEKISRGERMVRNPRTGERKLAEPTAVPRFRAGTDLKAYVSGARPLPSTAGGSAPSAEQSAMQPVAAPPAPGTTGTKNGARKTGSKRAGAKKDGGKNGSKKAVISTSSTKGAGRQVAARG